MSCSTLCTILAYRAPIQKYLNLLHFALFLFHIVKNLYWNPQIIIFNYLPLIYFLIIKINSAVSKSRPHRIRSSDFSLHNNLLIR